MESGDFGSRRADCGSADGCSSSVSDVTALLPLTGTFVSSRIRTLYKGRDRDREGVHQSYTMVLVSKPYLTYDHDDTLASPSVDSGPMISISNTVTLHLRSLPSTCDRSPGGAAAVAAMVAARRWRRHPASARSTPPQTFELPAWNNKLIPSRTSTERQHRT
jgi:hypothetical protein